ncbi:MAG: hypothetical protein H6674_10485 [Dehalococcoidia bacterium]|nr:hypothetical protein [Dehalococcoidia bacterium]MCB9508194.1 hypothetical protein [Myxococcales bacterium]
MAGETPYLCPDGYLRTGEPGRCPEHQSQLRPATHRCPSCGYAALEAKHCPTCRTPLTQVG